MNDITELLNLEDSNIEITDIHIEDRTKIITIETRPLPRFCPLCGYRMYSKGIRKRTINHPILQDSYKLIIHLKQRRWKCTNPQCQREENEVYNFVNKRCRNTNSTDLLIVNEFKDLTKTATDIARKFNTSDTHALEVFNRFVGMERLPLTDAISVDEVYLDMDSDCRYVLMLQDFYTGEPIDMVQSRKQQVTEPYFASIPKEERFAVKYLISDMYNEYIRYVDRYFPNAISVVDSFHVVQWINKMLNDHIIALTKKFKARDEERQRQISYENGRQIKLSISDEVYLLKNYQFFLLAKPDTIVYHEDTHMDYHFRYYMNTGDYERKFFNIDPSLSELRRLRDKYLSFNTSNAGRPQKAAIELEELIDEYKACDQPIFNEFARLLKRYKQPIINSFILIERADAQGKIVISRLSNGPIESLNRKAKDLKRLARGFRNYDNLRNRFLYATRSNAVLNGRISSKKESASSLRFASTVTKERQRYLLSELDNIMEKYPDMTKDESMALRHWVAQGNTPYSNPDYICDEHGMTSDFIAASRILDEAFKE